MQTRAPCCSEFYVTKEAIQRLPKEFYVQARNWLASTSSEISTFYSGRCGRAEATPHGWSPVSAWALRIVCPVRKCCPYAGLPRVFSMRSLKLAKMQLVFPLQSFGTCSLRPESVPVLLQSFRVRLAHHIWGRPSAHLQCPTELHVHHVGKQLQGGGCSAAAAPATTATRTRQLAAGAAAAAACTCWRCRWRRAAESGWRHPRKAEETEKEQIVRRGTGIPNIKHAHFYVRGLVMYVQCTESLHQL